MLGGSYSKTGKRTQGHFVTDMISKFSFDVAIFGLDGSEGLDGPGTQTEDAVFTNMAVMKRSKRNILIMDPVNLQDRLDFSMLNFPILIYWLRIRCLISLKARSILR